ncbi:rhotekin-2-like isoform X2 [Argiope bruennichi]|uniref:rhotekin-2-like isoform X2 n=1 Tax=Argiope bruennichi TaxID=94029 RepID=UPI0024953EFE|nr:rhotekin-2-like isoform X2 [Argiope bruennichi]
MPRYIYALWQKSVHFCQIDTEEYDLEQKIDLEIKMQEGTNKLLAACRYQLQSLEALKSLLTSNERISAYMLELQRRKSLKQTKSPQKTPLLPCSGKVAISDIRMPLIWKDSDHFKNRGDYRRFAVFCLLKVGTEVFDTAMINNVDRSMTDIAFEDVITFNNVPQDFEFRLEVYSHVLQEDLSIASASNKLKKKISYSVSRAIGKRMSDNFREDGNTKNGYSDFELVAHAKLNLSDANSRIKTYDLVMETTDKHNQLPLFGHFCCRLAVQPKCMVEEVYSGYLSLVQQIGNITGSRRMLCSLKNFTLSMWSNFADVHSSNPDVVIPIKTGTKVTPSSKAISYPRFSFRVEYTDDDETKEHLLAADSPIQLSEWLNHISQHIKDYELWKPASESLMEISSPGVCRNSQFIRHRNSSLYDETPFLDDGETSSGSYGSSSTIYGKNGHRVSTPPFCSWSSSSSSTNSSLEYQPHPTSRTLYRKSVSAYFPSFFHS